MKTSLQYASAFILSFVITLFAIIGVRALFFKPYFTIIISSYNYGKFLDKALDSVYNSTYRNFEVIVVNDGSNDNTQEILDSYRKTHRDFYTITQKNIGLSASRNRAMKYARGEYIWFVDADDWIEKKALEKLHKKATHLNPDIISFYTRTYTNENDIYGTLPKLHGYDLLPNTIKMQPSQVFSGASLSTYDMITYPVTSGKQIYKRAFLEEHNILFPEHTLFEDDVFFLTSLFNDAKVSALPVVLYHKRVHDNSIVVNRPRYYDSTVRIARLLYENGMKSKCDPQKVFEIFSYYASGIYSKWGDLSDIQKYHFFFELEVMDQWLQEQSQKDERLKPEQKKLHSFVSDQRAILFNK